VGGSGDVASTSFQCDDSVTLCVRRRIDIIIRFCSSADVEYKYREVFVANSQNHSAASYEPHLGALYEAPITSVIFVRNIMWSMPSSSSPKRISL